MPYDKKVSKLEQKKISYNQAWESSDDAYKARFGGDTAEGKAKAIEAMKDYNKTHSKHYSTLNKAVTRLNNDKSLIENVRNKPTEIVHSAESTGINRPESHTADIMTGGSQHLMEMAEKGYYSLPYVMERSAKQGNPYEVTPSPVNPNKTDYKMPTGKDDIDFSKTKFVRKK